MSDVPKVGYVPIPVAPDESPYEALHRLPDNACAWCGEPTPMRAVTPFRPDLGSVPMHLLCGSDMREAYRAWKERAWTLREGEIAGMRRLSAYVKGASE